MQHAVDPLMLKSSAGAAGTALVLNGISLSLFGVPLSTWIFAFSGALFGAAFLPTESKLNRPLTIFACMFAGIVITAGTIALSGIEKQGYIIMIAFISSSSPAPIVKRLQKKFFGVEDASDN